MAGRPEKYTISYFPHYVRESKTLFILENKFGAEGYMFWFKLLELLCNSKGLYYACNDNSNFDYLCAKTSVSKEKAGHILNTLAKLNKIDKELWEKKIIWCQDLVDNVSDVFKRRKSEIPSKPINVNNNLINASNNLNTDSKKAIYAPQRKVKKSKLNKSNKKHNVETKTFDDASEEINLSKYLFEKIRKNNPDHKKPNFQNWAKHIDFMIRIDKRAPERIKEVIEWCQQDSFWHKNILSTAKLREKFDQLYLGMKGKNNGHKRDTKRFANEREYDEEERRKIEENFYA